jgi:hypothetical protein
VAEQIVEERTTSAIEIPIEAAPKEDDLVKSS